MKIQAGVDMKGMILEAGAVEEFLHFASLLSNILDVDRKSVV